MSLTEQITDTFSEVKKDMTKPGMCNVFRLGVLWVILYVIVASLIIVLALSYMPQTFSVAEDTLYITLGSGSDDGIADIDLRFMNPMWSLYCLDAIILILIAYFTRQSIRYKAIVKTWKAFYDEHHPQNT